MKKITLILGLAVLTLGAVACKKDYSCDCTYKEYHDGHYHDEMTSTSIKDAKKDEAEASCEAQETSLKANPEHSEVSCKLK